MEETLRICRNHDVLKEYLADEEAATIMFTLLDEQKAKKFWEEEIRQESEAKGEAKLSLLITKLIESGRNSDVPLAATDENYRKKLYIEFGV